MNEMRMKRCSMCNDVLLIMNFNRDRNHPDGYENRCKMCRSERRKAIRCSKARLYLALTPVSPSKEQEV